jgi:hypothetical protein
MPSLILGVEEQVGSGSTRQFPIGPSLVRPQHLPRHDNQRQSRGASLPTSSAYDLFATPNIKAPLSYHTIAFYLFTPLILFLILIIALPIFGSGS